MEFQRGICSYAIHALDVTCLSQDQELWLGVQTTAALPKRTCSERCAIPGVNFGDMQLQEQKQLLPFTTEVWLLLDTNKLAP